MALFTPSESPAVVVKEVDLTGGVPNVQSSTGAYVGTFRWGPVRQATLVSTEAELAEKFSTPNNAATAHDFLSATQFLRYSSNLYVVREATTAAVNAASGTYGSQNEAIQIRNREHYDSLTFGADSSDNQVGMWIAKYPGALGNSLAVHILPATGTFSSWTYAKHFDRAPGTSTYASNKLSSSANDEIHVIVIDEDGEFTGTKGSVLETYPHVSIASDAKNEEGASNYVADVVNDRSEYIWFGTWELDADSDGQADVSTVLANAGKSTTAVAALSPAVYQTGAGTGQISRSLADGVDSAALGTAEVATGFDLFEDTDTITVDFLIAPGMTSQSAQVSVANDLISIASSTRKDCIAITSPSRADIVNASTPNANAVTFANLLTFNSYGVIDNNYLKVYDKYNDAYRMIPAASTTAGIMAATDTNAAPWFSPAGSRRGQYFGITSLAYSPTKAERDTLYKAGVNPISNIPGQGVLLFGDKTHMNRPSAFDRINVRRLFLVLERAIGEAAKGVMFEFNDEFTRSEFVNIVEPVLREVQGRRGITDFKVVCDSTNNTAAVIDRNEFIANIFIKPARSINYVTLNFVAVRTGVEFEEVVGTV